MTVNNKITVNLTPEFRLKDALEKAGIADPATVTSLAVCGEFLESDAEYIKKNMELQVLDLCEASMEWM